MSQADALPNLLIIGAMKCGTTSLHGYLNQHPEISMSRVKEPNFFLEPSPTARQVAWYQSLCDPGAKVRGEASHWYTHFPHYPGLAERISVTLPEARLVYIIRDPLRQLVSHYVNHVDRAVEDRPFDEAMNGVEQPDHYYGLVCRYHDQLRQFTPHFPRDRIHVLTLEQLQAEPDAALAALFRFLDVDDGVKIDTSRVLHSSERKRMPTPLGRRVVPLIDKSVGWLPSRVAWQVKRAARWPVTRPMPRFAFSPEASDRLWRRLLPQIEAIAADFPACEIAPWLLKDRAGIHA